jgi:hypothetical protein
MNITKKHFKGAMIILALGVFTIIVPACKKITEEEVCEPSIGLKSENVLGTTADLSWDVALDAVQYVVQYRKVGSSTFSEAGRPKTNSISLSSLSNGTDYEWKVQTNCPGANSVFSELSTFKTKTVNEVSIQRKWKIQSWRTNGVPLTLSGGDYAEFKKDGVYEQQLIGATSSGTWLFNNTAQTLLKINTAINSEWKIFEISNTSLKLARTSPTPEDTVVFVPF